MALFIGFVDASFTTRFGGVSRGVLGSLNLGFNRGDTEENLLTNWKRCAASMDCSLEQMIATDQVHGTEIIKAEEGQGLGTGLAPAAVSGLTAASAVRAGSSGATRQDLPCVLHSRTAYQSISSTLLESAFPSPTPAGRELSSRLPERPCRFLPGRGAGRRTSLPSSGLRSVEPIMK